MFDKLKKWNLNRKLVKEVTSKNVNYFKIRDLINQGANFNKIVKYSASNSFYLTRFAPNEHSKPEIKELRRFFLKQNENLIYEQYKQTIKKVAKTKLKSLAIKFNEARIE